MTASDRKFGWGGTFVKEQRKCPKTNSTRTEISCWPKREMLVWFQFSVWTENVQAWLIDPFHSFTIRLEVSEKLPQG